MTATATTTTDSRTPKDTPSGRGGAAPGIFARGWGSCFAALYNPLLWRTERRGNALRRSRLLETATGAVVELGAGTGHNLEHYPADVELVLTEPHEAMARRLEQRVLRSDKAGTLIRAGAEDLPLPDASADTVVSTLVLCTVDDVEATLAEARRVLRPGGKLLFIEHVAAAEETLRRWQQRARNFWHGFACGCHTDRETERAIREAGFEVSELVYDELEFDLPLIRPLIWGTAVNPVKNGGLR